MDACLYIRGNEWKNFEEKLRTFLLRGGIVPGKIG